MRELPVDCFTGLLDRAAGALVADRPRKAPRRVARAVSDEESPWLTVEEAARRARCGPKTIYKEVRNRRLRAARVGGRRELRLKPEWVDEWLLKMTTPVDA